VHAPELRVPAQQGGDLAQRRIHVHPTLVRLLPPLGPGQIDPFHHFSKF
jgi:hypothetical protein